MPFTFISRISLQQGEGGHTDTHYFYPVDIDLVRAQDGVDAVKPFPAIVQGKETTVLVGVKIGPLPSGELGVIETFDQPEHKVAVACPPFNDEGRGGKELLLEETDE